MIRLTKQADYAIVLLIRMVEVGAQTAHSARDLAEDVGLPAPIVSKILKALAREGLLASIRGVNGGYRLARPAEAISVAEIISALEGPLALTECQSDHGALCCLHPSCSSRAKWNRINQVIYQTLEGITLAEMAQPLSPAEALVAISVPGGPTAASTSA